MGTARIEAKWAIILSVITFILFILYKLIGFTTPEKIGTTQWIDLGLSLVVMAYTFFSCLKEKRDSVYNGVMSWGEGFWTGARMTLLVAVFAGFLLMIFMYLIDTDYISTWGDYLTQAGAPSGETADDGLYSMNEFLTSHCIMASIFGLVITSIVAFIVKREAE